MPSRLDITLLGEVVVQRDNERIDTFRTRKSLALLAYLVRTGREHSRDVLADLLWDNSTPKQAQSNLRTVLYYLRRALPDYCVIQPATVAFDAAQPHRADVVEFEAHLSAARTTITPGKPISVSEAARLARALDLYEGEFLAGFHLRGAARFEAWMIIEREALNRRAVEAFHLLVDFYLRRQRYTAGIDAATRLLALEPLDEGAHRRLMELLARAGRRSTALAQYEQCRELLRAELGLEPNEETQHLYEKILGGAFELVTPPPRKIQSPYKGLASFTEDDAPLFFGRENLIALLLARLGGAGAEPWSRRFLAVVGPSGSGKSSLVRAGLLPALRRVGQGDLPSAAWQHSVVMVPGAEPLTALAAGLGGPLHLPDDVLLARLRSDTGALAKIFAQRSPAQGGVLLVIDQLEEVYTLASETERRQMTAALVQAIRAPGGLLGIVVALRADYYARPLYHAELGSIFHERAQVVVPMSSEELRRTIVGPADLVGLAVEPALAAALVADARRTQSALPLLQYALAELFEMREGLTLTVGAYRELGGLAGALAGRVESIYSNLDPAQKLATRQIFLRLVMPTDIATDAPDTGRRVPLADLRDLASDVTIFDTVIQLFSRHRFLRLDHDPATQEPSVELAHEALLEAWNRLRIWVNEAREALYRHRRLESLAETWEEAGRDASYLLRGRQLAQFEDLSVPVKLTALSTGTMGVVGNVDPEVDIPVVAALAPPGAAFLSPTGLVLGATESAYLEASLQERAAVKQREAARRAREAELEWRIHRRQRVLTWVLTVATVIALSLAGFALTQRRRALISRRRAERTADVARSLNLASNARIVLSESDGDLALKLALEANQLPDPPPQARLMLAEAAYAPGTRRRLEGHTAPVEGVVVLPDGLRALSASADHTLILWDLVSGTELRRFEGHTDVVHDVVLLAGGTMALSASADGSLILWDIERGEARHTLTGHGGAIWSVDVSPGCESPESTGCLALSGSADGALMVWDLAALRSTGAAAMLHRLEGHEGTVYSVAIGPDGRRALSGSADRSVILWDLARGEQLRTMTGIDDTITGSQQALGHYNGVWGVAFRPDGLSALSASQDESVIWWDLETGQVITRFDVDAGVFSIALSRDGRRALLGTLDNRLLFLDVERGDFLRELRGHTGRLLDVAFTPDETGALTGSATGALRLWNLHHGGELRRLAYDDPPDPAACDVAVSPDGKLGLTGLWTGEISLWDYASGEEIRRLRGHTQMVFGGVHFLPGERRVVSGAGDIFAVSTDNTVRLWDVETGEELQRMAEHTDKIWDSDVSPDGRWVASGSHDGTLRLWHIASGEDKVLLDVYPQGVRSVAFSPDGDVLAVGLAKGGSSTPDYSVRVLEVETGREVRRLEGHSEFVSGLAFSPDGALILSGSHDQTAILWDGASGKLHHRLIGHTCGILAVAFSPDGGLALTGDTDGSLLLWDVHSGLALRHYGGIFKPAVGVVFTPEGETFLTASDDDAVHEFRIDHGQAALLDWIAANRYVPSLTCEQRVRYQVEPLCDETLP
jgi:WD40 repeat protein/DNA-binding SARP family transcriptional activator